MVVRGQVVDIFNHGWDVVESSMLHLFLFFSSVITEVMPHREHLCYMMDQPHQETLETKRLKIGVMTHKNVSVIDRSLIVYRSGLGVMFADKLSYKIGTPTRVILLIESQQLEVEGEGDENVPLYTNIGTIESRILLGDMWFSVKFRCGNLYVPSEGVPSPFQTHPNSSSFFNIGTPTHWQTPRPSQHGSSNWQAQMSAQVGPSNWQSHMPAQSATPYWQPAFPSHPGTYNPNLQPSIERHHDNILNRGKREQRPSFYKRSPYMEQPATTVLPKQRGNKNKNNVKKANSAPLNLWSALDDENEGGDDVVYLGGRFTGNYLVYENVNPEKVKQENYVTYIEFLNNPEDIYLSIYEGGFYIISSDLYWQQLVPL
ncbi:hypothetical protein Tco_0497719 [Tanacetum coccineum]